MKKILLKPLYFLEQVCIGIYFENYPSINLLLRKELKARWSQSNKCWYLAFTKDNYNKVLLALKNKANVDDRGLQEWLSDKKQVKTKQATAVGIQQQELNLKTRNINKTNAHVLPAMEMQLKLKAYSTSTIKTYLGEMSQLLILLKSNAADNLTPDDLKRYLVYCYEKLELSENTLHSRINAMKFYYEQVLRREKFFWEIPRPKKRLLLPKLLNEIEITKLFNALTNKKHKAMLFTAYSSGLRVSEIVNIKITDIDSGSMQLLIQNAKGKKDRYVNLSPVLLDILRKYVSQYEPRPSIYLFESEQTFLPYPIRTVQQIFYNAKKKAGIKKEVGIHSLRHSFATHLLDKGTDIKYIKDLLGHFDIRTTERYLHVSKQKLVNIISPFDDLWQQNEVEW